MSDEKKYVVPEGMLRAAEESMRPIGGIPFAYIDRILEVAVRWLAENPIAPTKAQRESLNEWLCGARGGERRDAVVEWQRRMFLAPEPDTGNVDSFILWYAINNAPSDAVGVDIYSAQGTLIGSLGLTKKDEKPEREEDLERDVHEHGKATTQPEIPEAIKNLMWPNARSAKEHDESIIEAFRRGQASAGKTEPWNKGKS